LVDDSDMLAAVRHAGGLPDAHPDYTDARIRLEINDCLRTVFARSVVNSRGGYWLHSTTVDLVADQAYYRVPVRALAGGLQRIEVRPTSSDNFRVVREVSPFEVAEQDTKTHPTPFGYWLEADHIRFVGIPSSANGDVRFWFYVRPPRLMQEQVTSSVYDGTITAINAAIAALLASLPAAYESLTVRAALGKILSVLAGPTSGAGSTTETFKTPDGLTDDVEITNDGTNRTATDLTPS